MAGLGLAAAAAAFAGVGARLSGFPAFVVVIVVVIVAASVRRRDCGVSGRGGVGRHIGSGWLWRISRRGRVSRRLCGRVGRRGVDGEADRVAGRPLQDIGYAVASGADRDDIFNAEGQVRDGVAGRGSRFDGVEHGRFDDDIIAIGV